jgi:hypothetical protein
VWCLPKLKDHFEKHGWDEDIDYLSLAMNDPEAQQVIVPEASPHPISTAPEVEETDDSSEHHISEPDVVRVESPESENTCPETSHHGPQTVDPMVRLPTEIENDKSMSEKISDQTAASKHCVIC